MLLPRESDGTESTEPDSVTPSDMAGTVAAGAAGDETVAKIFETMEYGPAPEDAKVAQVNRRGRDSALRPAVMAEEAVEEEEEDRVEIRPCGSIIAIILFLLFITITTMTREP